MDMYNALHAQFHAAREYLTAPATKSQFLEKGMLTVSGRPLPRDLKVLHIVPRNFCARSPTSSYKRATI